MKTILLTVLLASLTACEDDDPSTSPECKHARAQYIMAKAARDYAADLGTPVYDTDAALAKFKSDHWECFK